MVANTSQPELPSTWAVVSWVLGSIFVGVVVGETLMFATRKPKPEVPPRQLGNPTEEVIGTVTEVEKVIERNHNGKLIELTLLHFTHDEGHDTIYCNRVNWHWYTTNGSYGHFIMEVALDDDFLGYPIVTDVKRCALKLSKSKNGVDLSGIDLTAPSETEQLKAKVDELQKRLDRLAPKRAPSRRLVPVQPYVK